MSREEWRHLPFNNEAAGRQLALSESLLTDLTQPSLYWYQATGPAVILGAGQQPTVLDLPACHSAGYKVYKRTSGGTVVLAGPDFISLDIALPPTSRLTSSDITTAYRWLGECWVITLARLGVAARLVAPEEARQARLELPPVALLKLVCFGTLSPYEVVSEDGRKLVGLAQIKRRGGSLLQSGLHLSWPGSQFARLLNLPTVQREQLTGQLAAQATGLADLLNTPPLVAQIVTALEESLTQHWPVELQPGDWTTAELEQAHQLELTKFATLS